MDKPDDPLAAAGLGAAPEPPDAPIPDPPEPEPEEEAVVPAGAENPDAVLKAIQAERKKAREANARAREYEARLRTREEEGKPLEERVSTAQAEAREATLLATRYEVAAEVGLDLKLAPRLQGTTREELLADAETFKPLIGAPAPAAPPDGGHRPQPPAKPDPLKDHNALVSSLFGMPSGRSDPLAGLTPAPQD